MGNGVSQALRGFRELREKKAIRVLRVPPAPRAKGASQVLKGHRDLQGQRVKKGNRVLRVLPARMGSVVRPVLKGCRGLQGQREIPQIPTGCNTLKTAFPNWKRDSRRPASELMGGS